jgi:hypothetical protein
MRNPQIDAVFKECSDLCDKKNEDYASPDDFYKNFRLVETIGIPVWVGIITRFLDKFSRLTGFVKRYMTTGKLHVQHECIEDTFLDGINYLALGLITYREWKEKTSFKIKIETDNNDVDKKSVYSMSRND